MEMSPFIARMILKVRKDSLEAGQARYRAYFVNTSIYEKYKEDVDTILATEGFEDCIVTV